MEVKDDLQLYWPCACVKRDKSSNLTHIKENHRSVAKCRTCNCERPEMIEWPPKITKRQREIIAHAVGALLHVKKSAWGFRNRFCAEIGTPAEAEWNELVQMGLAKQGMTINDGQDRYYFVLADGCAAIGLGPAATRRAMSA